MRGWFSLYKPAKKEATIFSVAGYSGAFSL
jgi:hypothetical protein